MAIDKAAMLGAIAAGGSRAKAAYDQSLAQLQAGQQSAVQQALANSVAQSVPTEGQSQLAARISEPYQNQSAALTANRAYSDDYFNQIGTSSGAYMDQAAALIPAIEKQWQEKLAYELALREWDAANSGSGGGSGGGGGGGSDDPFLSLTKSLGGKENLKDYFSGMGDKYQARAAAIEAGVPESIANSWFTKYGSGDEEYQDLIPGSIAAALARKYSVKKYRQDARAAAGSIPGNQIKLRKAAVQAFKKAKRKRK